MNYDSKEYNYYIENVSQKRDWGLVLSNVGQSGDGTHLNWFVLL